MTENVPAALADTLEELAAEICAEFDLVVYDLQILPETGRISLVIDRAGGSSPGNGVTVSDITRVSKQIGYQLDTEDLVPFSYQFEVSSPGVERDLNTARQVRQNIGRDVRIVLGEQTEDDRRIVEGVLESFSDGVLSVASGENRWEIELDNVRRARTVFDFASTKAKRKK
ncbi:MAG: ribosome maturation factor RimP [Bradymonadia bacterium]|jgi:ribosome maturation factor RimP